MNRAERRRAERLADRAIAKAPSVLTCDPSTDVAIVREDGATLIVREVDAWRVLSPMGLVGVLEEIHRARAEYGPWRLPTIVIAGGHASVAMAPAHYLSPGGQA